MAFAVALMVLFAVCASNAWSSDDFINSTQGYGAGIWWTNVYGNVNYTNPLSLRGDLGLAQAAGITANAEFQFNDKWGGAIDYTGVHMTGSNIIARNTVFNGNKVLAGDQFNSVLNASTLKFIARYNLVRTEDSTLALQAGANLIAVDIGIKKGGIIDPVNAPGFNFNLKPAASFLPIIGLSGKQRISDRIHAFGDFSGMFKVGTGSVKSANYVDFRAGLRYNFVHPGWYADLEYKVLGTNVVKTDGNSVNLFMGGPAVCLRYEF